MLVELATWRGLCYPCVYLLCYCASQCEEFSTWTFLQVSAVTCVVLEQFDDMAGGITETGEPYSPFVSVSLNLRLFPDSFERDSEKVFRVAWHMEAWEPSKCLQRYHHKHDQSFTLVLKVPQWSNIVGLRVAKVCEPLLSDLLVQQ